MLCVLALLAVLCGVWYANWRGRQYEICGAVPSNLWVTCHWIPSKEVQACSGLYEKRLRKWENRDVWEKEAGRLRRWMYFDKGRWVVVGKLGGKSIAASHEAAKSPLDALWTVHGEDFIVSAISTVFGFQVGEIVVTNRQVTDNIMEGTKGRIIGGEPHHLIVSFKGYTALVTPTSVDRQTGPTVSVLCKDLAWRRGIVISKKQSYIKVQFDDASYPSERLHIESPRLLSNSVCCTVRDTVILSHSATLNGCLKSSKEVGRVIKDMGPFVKNSYKVKSPTGEVGLYSRNDLLPLEHSNGALKRQVQQEDRYDEPSYVKQAALDRERISERRLESSFEILSEESLEDFDSLLGVVETPLDTALEVPGYLSVSLSTNGSWRSQSQSLFSPMKTLDRPPSFSTFRLCKSSKKNDNSSNSNMVSANPHFLGSPTVPIVSPHETNLSSIADLIEDEIFSDDSSGELEQPVHQLLKDKVESDNINDNVEPARVTEENSEAVTQANYIWEVPDCSTVSDNSSSVSQPQPLSTFRNAAVPLERDVVVPFGSGGASSTCSSSCSKKTLDPNKILSTRSPLTVQKKKRAKLQNTKPSSQTVFSSSLPPPRIADIRSPFSDRSKRWQNS
eukprot:TRINITY_DN30999_c0_g1_i1.p1 TRINITY_DN30999_c0_g1~~TRINITY_DN30999_c0_g1_i1.p1  ORF type:complete len:618 (+),score=69.95 TRINITY_DN30999_c0_g1_i1:45-1898(+)